MISYLAIRFSLGLIAVFLMILVTWGFRHSFQPALVIKTLRFPLSNTAGGTMRVALTLFHLNNLFRIGFWDVVRPFLGWTGVMEPAGDTLMISLANSTFIMIAIVASLLALAGLWRAIPASERGNYNILTAAFYPQRRFTRRTLQEE